MLPIGILMIEHRLIERMVKIIRFETEEIRKGNKIDHEFINNTVDFIRTYTDKCHHGKEEDIFFRELGRKEIPPELRELMQRLIDEHVWGRGKVNELVFADEQFKKGFGTSVFEIADLLDEIADFYPKHIEKEDRHFFKPATVYFTGNETKEMLGQFEKFDSTIDKAKYEKLVEELEKELS